MTITLNGKPHELNEPLSLTSLIETLDYGDRKVAVAVNETFVPRKAYKTTILQQGDTVEVVAPMPGG